MRALNRISQKGRGDNCFSSVDPIWPWKILEISKKEGTGNGRNHSEYLVSKYSELCVCAGSQCWIPRTVRWSFVAWLSGGWWLTNFRFCVRRNGSGIGSDQPTSDFRLYVRRNGSGGGWWSANKWYPSLRAQKRKRSVPNLPKTSERGIASRYQPCLVSVNSTDRFHFAVLLFSN